MGQALDVEPLTEEQKILRQHNELWTTISELLGQYGVYTYEEIHEIVAILEDVGIRNIKAFAVLEQKDLEAKNMKPAVIHILMKKAEEMKRLAAPVPVFSG
nr:uncharacterized protein LOC129384104 [Dermacentor andersoni]